MPAERTETLIKVALEAPFVLLHISVLLFIAGQIWKRNATFSTPFFILYSVQSAVDILYYIHTLVFVRFFRIWWLPVWFGESPTRNYISFAASFPALYQLVSHAAIALNRYRTIASKSATKRESVGRSLIAELLFLAIVCLVPSILRFTYQFSATADSRGLNLIIPAKSLTNSVANFSNFLYCIVTSVVSLGLELSTLHVYRNLSASLRTQLRSDFRLLLYAMVQLVGQFLVSISMSFTILAGVTGDTSYAYWSQLFHPYAVDILSFSGPVCLLVTRATRQLVHISAPWSGRRDPPSISGKQRPSLSLAIEHTMCKRIQRRCHQPSCIVSI